MSGHDILTTKETSSCFKSLLEETLRCPVCMETCFAPVLQCDNGHAVCNVCLPLVPICPICNSQNMGYRATSIEVLASDYLWSCVYSENGCKDAFNFNDAGLHRQVCSHRPVACCPVLFCRTEINFDSADIIHHMISQHSATEHSSTKIFEGGDTLVVDFENHCVVDVLSMHSARVLRYKGIELIFYCIETHYEIEFHFVRVDKGAEKKGSISIETSVTDKTGKKFKKTEMISFVKKLYELKQSKEITYLGNCLSPLVKKTFKKNFLRDEDKSFLLWISVKHDIPLQKKRCFETSFNSAGSSSSGR